MTKFETFKLIKLSAMQKNIVGKVENTAYKRFLLFRGIFKVSCLRAVETPRNSGSFWLELKSFFCNMVRETTPLCIATSRFKLTPV